MLVPSKPDAPGRIQQGEACRLIERATHVLDLRGHSEGGKVRFLGSSAGTAHRVRVEMIIRKDQAPVDRGTDEDAQMYGARKSLHLSDAGGLAQFVAHVQTL
jgi:hypothetical protein